MIYLNDNMTRQYLDVVGPVLEVPKALRRPALEEAADEADGVGAHVGRVVDLEREVHHAPQHRHRVRAGAAGQERNSKKNIGGNLQADGQAML
jgi:hypothetical protein